MTPQKKKEGVASTKRKDDSVSMLKKMSPDRKADKSKTLTVADDELAGASSVEERKKDNEERIQDEDDEEDGRKASVLPRWVKFPLSNDEFYPAEFDSVIYDCYNLRIVFDREKTGFEETKDFPIVINSIIAGRYQVVEYLGSAAFSKAIQCYDIHTEQMVCMKIIENNKDYFDHRILDGSTLPLEQKFIQVGRKGLVAEAMQPGDQEAPPGFTINCRCVLAFVNVRDSQGRLIRKQ